MSVVIDWNALGVARGVHVHAPAVARLQAAADVNLPHMPVPAHQGLFVIVRPGSEGET